MQKTGREKIARAKSLSRWKDEIRGASSEADLDKGMKSSPIAIGGKAEFIGTDEGRSIYLTYYFLVSFSEMELNSETFHSPTEGGCLWTPFKDPLWLTLILFS